MRRDPDMVLTERHSFVKLVEIEDHQWSTLDVFRNPNFSPELLDDYDAFMIGGLSADPSDSIEIPESFSPWIDNLYNLMRYALRIKKPGMLSCGGFMLASMMLGAEIVIDPEQQELGVYDMHLTSSAREDLLFSDFPKTFKAVSGHIKSTNTIPANCELLISSERCAIHGFKVIDAPFYAFQFHPEIHCDELQARVELYKDKYFKTEHEYLEFIKLIDDTSTANRMIPKFIELVRTGSFLTERQPI